MSWKECITYRHCETISMPKELFIRQEGMIAIKLCAFKNVETRCKSVELDTNI